MNRNQYVTGIIPMYNSVSFVGESINSIVNQTYEYIKLILVDDISTDTTFSFVSNIIKHRDNILLVKNKYNKGYAGALNTGLDLVDTQFIAFLDSDDIAEPDRIESQIDLLNNRHDVGVCGGWMMEFGSGNKVREYQENDLDVRASILFHTPIPHPTAMVKTDIINNLRFDGKIGIAEDFRFWIEIGKITQYYNLPKVVTNFRIHESSVTSMNRERQYISWKDTLSDFLSVWSNFTIWHDDNFYRTIFKMKHKSFGVEFVTKENIYTEFLENILSMNQQIKIFDQKALTKLISGKIEDWKKFVLV